MAASATINTDLLLAPISESAPAGVNLRLDVSPTSTYYRLKDARSGARAAERRADAEGGVQSLAADWQTILTLAPKALAEKSKDLEVTAWLIEGLVRVHGFAGLRDGVSLARGLVERYWESFFSLEDEDGLATRLAPIAGLNGQGNEGTLIQPLRKIPVTAGRNEDSFAVYHYDQARALSNVSDAEVKARREAAGEVSMERFTAAVNASGGAFYISLIEDIEGALQEIELLAQALGERAGREAPRTSDIAGALNTILNAIRSFSGELVARALAAAGAGAAGDAAQGTTGNAGATETVMSSGGVNGRDEALRTLLEVAEYFKKFEPHSPISNSLEEIVRRARMPFAELLAELLPDHTAWRSALTSAGIKPPPE
jgi:type VI secretion system protein ImpA